jgi:fermentation-respiration switch protein FrsA (DUF1100 family)
LINIVNERINNIPVLHIAKQELWKQPIPFVMFIHGFTSAKEHNLHIAYLLAQKGFRVVLPDIAFHGDRAEGYRESELYPRFWPIVVQTIKELAYLKDAFIERNLIDSEKIGIAGTSLGGIVTNGALATYDWITAGVSLMGNPSYVDFANMQVEMIKQQYPNFPLSDEDIENQFSLIKKYDLSLQSEKLAGRPVLFWHGANDPIVPYKHAYTFYEKVRPSYQTENKLKFILDQNAGHKVSREGVLQTAEWFAKHLTPNVLKV